MISPVFLPEPRTVRVISDDQSLIAAVERIASGMGYCASTISGDGPRVLDAAVGLPRIRELAERDPSLTAVIRSQRNVAALFLAVRTLSPTLIADPRVAPDTLQGFLRAALPSDRAKAERRSYPRATGSGLRVSYPPNANLLDISPYGARIWLPSRSETSHLLDVRLQLAGTDSDESVKCQVVGRQRIDNGVALRVRFVTISPAAQQEFFRIAKAAMLCETIASTVQHCEQSDVAGYRRITSIPALEEVHRALATDCASLTFSSMAAGRPVKGIVDGLDDQGRRLLVELAHDQWTAAPGTYVSFATTIRHRNYMGSSHVLSLEGRRAALSWPGAYVLSDERAEQRLSLGVDSPIRVVANDTPCPVTDISPTGFSFFVPEHSRLSSDDNRLQVRFEFEDGTSLEETAIVRNRRILASGYTIGATLLDRDLLAANDGSTRSLVEHELSAESVHFEPSSNRYRAQRVTFESGPNKIAGLWSETLFQDGPRSVVVVPPAWAKTKESVSLLAQFLCATFDACGRHLAVLRIDYSNALGESEKDHPFRQPGKETLGLTCSACVADIRAAITYAQERLAETPPSISLIGMSFSGPLCLAAAAQDDRVAGVVELMGASDIQDLIRAASGGIDYVANHRAGAEPGIQNLLGILSDIERWCEDGLQHRLLLLRDSQRRVEGLRVPLLWVHGVHDAFVNPERIRAILASATGSDRTLVLVPCGHVPTKTTEALLSYAPVADFLLGRKLAMGNLFAIPAPEVVAEEAAHEWKSAPKTQLASPKEYWRNYMLGEGGDSLGFDVLAMTPEYQQMMELQVELLAAPPGQVVHDLGGGGGHSLPFFARSASDVQNDVHLYDLVPQLLEEAARRAPLHGITLATTEWDAGRDPVPDSLRQARNVLMSLFLSCVEDPRAFLADVGAVLPAGARIVASSILPDADLSAVYANLLERIAFGDVPIPAGYSHDMFLAAVRDYMNSAAWLLRLAEEGTFHLFGQEEFERLFRESGLTIRSVHRTFGNPQRAVVLVAEKVNGRD